MLNYERIYNQLIQKRKSFPLYKKDGYCEQHHIKPKSLGGSNEKSNLVNLTAREHFIAHCLLVKIAERKNDKNMYNKMINAWSAMAFLPAESIKKFRLEGVNRSSYLYEALKKSWSQYFSENHSGENSPVYGKIYIWNKNTLKAKIVSKDFEYDNSEWTNNMPEELKRKGENAHIYGSVAFHNPETYEVKFFKDMLEIPQGWVKGFPENKKSVPAKNPSLGHTWIMNVELNEVKLWPKDEDVPTGWIKRRPGNNETPQEWKERMDKKNLEKERKKKEKEKRIAEKEKIVRSYYEVYTKEGFAGVVKKFGYKNSNVNLVRSFHYYIPEYTPKTIKRKI